MTRNGCPWRQNTELRPQRGTEASGMPPRASDQAVRKWLCKGPWLAMGMQRSGVRQMCCFAKSSSAKGRLPKRARAFHGPRRPACGKALRAQMAGTPSTNSSTSRTCPPRQCRSRCSSGSNGYVPCRTTSTWTVPILRSRAVSDPGAPNQACKFGWVGRRAACKMARRP